MTPAERLLHNAHSVAAWHANNGHINKGRAVDAIVSATASRIVRDIKLTLGLLSMLRACLYDSSVEQRRLYLNGVS